MFSKLYIAVIVLLCVICSQGAYANDITSKPKTAPSWFRVNLPWWTAMFKSEQASRLVNTDQPNKLKTADQNKQLDTLPSNVETVLLPYQGAGMETIMIEKESILSKNTKNSSIVKPPKFLPGPKFRGRSGEGSSEAIARQALQPYKNIEAMQVSGEALRNATDTIKEESDKLSDLRKNLKEFEAFHASFVESLVELETEAGLNAESLPAANPDMIPIPEKVLEIVNTEIRQENFPTTPVYIVKEPGKAFVENGKFFEARVGMDGPGLASYILKRSGPQVPNLDKSALGQYKARHTNELAGEKLKEYRMVINKNVPETPSHGIVEANLKPPPVPIVNRTVANLLNSFSGASKPALVESKSKFKRLFKV